jgi:mutual gliding-motility protein MglA
MVQLNHAQREITIKVVYYGPGLSGKTTNLQMIHQFMSPDARGRLMSLDTANDRTLFFDLLPVFFKTQAGFKVRIKLYTVPGQVMHNATRRIVLAGCDAIAFIADSQIAEAAANKESWTSMMENLKENGFEADEVPIVVQFNKRDLPNIRSEAELDVLRSKSREPIFEAVAKDGKGVLETLYALLRLTYRKINQKHDFERKFGLSEKEFLRNLFRNVDLKKSGALTNSGPNHYAPNPDPTPKS